MFIPLQNEIDIERQIIENKISTRKYHKEVAKNRRKLKGMCSRCGNTNDNLSYKTCTKCRVKTKMQYYKKLK